MAAGNNVEAGSEIQPEGSNPSIAYSDSVPMDGIKEIHMQNQPTTYPKAQEMRRSRSQIGSQITPFDMVPYSNNNIPATAPAPPPAPAPRVLSYDIDTNSGTCKNPLSLILFLTHTLIAFAGVGYFGFLGIQAALRKGKHKFHIEYWYPQLGAAAAAGVVFSCLWQAIIRYWPTVMVRGILWSSPAISFAASMVLVSTSKAASVGLGVVLLIFSITQALYACWVTPRMEYAATLLSKALGPTRKLIPDLHHPSYWTIVLAFLWSCVWSLGIVGAISHEYAALVVFGLLVSYAWTMEVLRNVVNVSVSRVIALFYMRGMQSDTRFSFHRAFTRSLGSISLGSVAVPVIECFRVLARALNLVEGEDEFMFSCAHCCLRVIEAIFRFGNNWAFVQVATYGKGFVKASRDTWDLFQVRELEALVNRDLTSALCFLSGVAGGALCVIVSGSWTFATHINLTATVSLVSFFIGYFMTRITMAMPHACVCAYYVCYAENPENRLFDNTIPDRMKQMEGSIV